MGRPAIVGVILAALAVGIGCQRAQTPDRGPILQPQQWADIDMAAAPEVERQFGLPLDQPAVQTYVRTVGQRVARAIASDELAHHFIVLDSHVLTACALPSGEVYVTRGLLERLNSEGELAALLAHELAHLAARHTESLIGRSVSPAMLTEAAAAAAARNSGASVSRRAEADLDKVVAAWLSVRYTPQMEADADRLGLDCLVAAGYHPSQMIPLAELLALLQGSEAAEFLSVHPNPTDRVGRIREAVARKYAGRGGRVGEQEYRREVLDRLAGR